ncbi:MAG: hypothetical protein AB7I19_18435 [Planctomycetota bacterium]
MRKIGLLVHTWLLLDFFGSSRRDGKEGSALTTSIFSQSFLAFALAAITFEPGASLLRFAGLHLSLSTLLMGIGALADPPSADRQLADRQLFHTAPIARSTLSIARVLHGAIRTTLPTIGVALPPAILCGYLRESDGVATTVLYLALAVLLASLAALAIDAFVRLTAVWFGSLRAALASGSLRAILFGVLFAGFLSGLPAVHGGAARLGPIASLLDFWPPWYAARILAEGLVPLAIGVLGGASLLLIAMDRWIPDHGGEASGNRSARGGGWLDRVEAALAGEGPLRAFTAWTGTMLLRSPTFRARVLPLLGLPVAMLIMSFVHGSHGDRSALLGVTMMLPAMGLPFLCAFLPRAEQEGAALVFETSPTATLALAREGSLIALSVRLILPLALLGLLILLMLAPPLTALSLGMFAAGAGVLAAAFTLGRLTHIPFTAGEDEPAALDLGILAPPTLVLAGSGAALGIAAGSIPGVAAAATVLAIAVRRLTKARRSARAR